MPCDSLSSSLALARFEVLTGLVEERSCGVVARLDVFRRELVFRMELPNLYQDRIYYSSLVQSHILDKRKFHNLPPAIENEPDSTRGQPHWGSQIESRTERNKKGEETRLFRLKIGPTIRPSSPIQCLENDPHDSTRRCLDEHDPERNTPSKQKNEGEKHYFPYRPLRMRLKSLRTVHFSPVFRRSRRSDSAVIGPKFHRPNGGWCGTTNNGVAKESS